MAAPKKRANDSLALRQVAIVWCRQNVRQLALRPGRQARGFSIVNPDAGQAYEAAVRAGATAHMPPAIQPWGQTVARVPDTIREAIHDLKAEHPAFEVSEIASICTVRFGRCPSPHTVKRLLAEDPSVPRIGAKRGACRHT